MASLSFAAIQAFFLAAFSKIIYCVIILIASAILVSVLNSITKKFLTSKMSRLDVRKADTIHSVLGSVIKVIVYFIAASSILTQFGINVASIIAVAGVGSVALAFGAQSLVKDVITGCFVLLEDQYGVGDVVTIAGVTGQVVDISLRTTSLRNPDGTLYVVPNGSVTIVESKSKQFMNAIVDVGIDYGEDMNKVLAVLNDEMDKVEGKVEGLRKRPDVLGIIGLDDSAVTVRIVAESMVGFNLPVERELRLIIKNRLDAEGITIPFPQCTVHMAKD